MSVSAIAQNYAETLVLLAAREGEEERYGELLGEISAVYRDVEDFRRFLDTPGISGDDKRRALREAFSGRAPELFMRFLLVVLGKRRQRWLPAMDAAYRDLLDDRAGRLHATIRLSFEPDEALRTEIMNGTNASDIKRSAVKRGMITLREDGRSKIREGLTTPDEVLRVTQLDVD